MFEGKINKSSDGLSRTEKRKLEERRGFLTNSLRALGAGAATTGAIAFGYPLAGGIDKRKMGAAESSLSLEYDPVLVNNVPVSMIGVAHTGATFETHQDTYREIIKKSPFVISEYFEQAMREHGLPQTTDQDRQELLLSITQFFSGIATICAEEGKDIIVVNPETEVTRLAMIANVLGLPTAAVFQLVGASDVRTGITRRDALVAAALAVPAAVTAGTAIKEMSEGERFSNEDWRDVMTADGIIKITQKYKDELDSQTAIPLIQGAYHAPTLHYLNNPELLEERKQLYAINNLIGDTSIRRFHFSKETNSWEIVE